MTYNNQLSVNYQGEGDTHFTSFRVPLSTAQIRDKSKHPFIATAQQDVAIRNEWGSNGITSRSDAYLFMPTPTSTFALYENDGGIAKGYFFDAPTKEFEQHMQLYMRQANQIRTEREKQPLDWKTFGLTKGTALAEELTQLALKQGRVVELGRIGEDDAIDIYSQQGQSVLGAILGDQLEPYMRNLIAKEDFIGKPRLCVVDPKSTRYKRIEPKKRMMLRRVALGGMTNVDQFTYFNEPYRNEQRHEHAPRGIKTIGHIIANAPFDVSGHYVATDIEPIFNPDQGSLEQRVDQKAQGQRTFDQLLRTESA